MAGRSGKGAFGAGETAGLGPASGLAAGATGGFAAGETAGLAPAAGAVPGPPAAGARAAPASAFAVSTGLSASPENRSFSLPAIADFINVIQIGSAALAPVSFSPSDCRLSKPTQTPQVTEGEKPKNHASV